MADIDLLQDFAILLPAAGLAGTLCRRLGLSVIVGYLVAGIIIGRSDRVADRTGSACYMLPSTVSEALCNV